MKKLRLAPLSLAILTVAACQDRSRDDVPVVTTTPGGTSTAPAADSAERRDNALVRVVNAIPQPSTIDVYADDVRAFENVAFKAVTPYHEMDGQYYAFRLQPAAGVGRTDRPVTNREGLDDGDFYTIFALPGEPAQLRIVEDDHSAPAAGKARVRIVHGASSLGELDVYPVGHNDALFDGVDFQSVTDYDEIDPLTGTLELRAEGDTRALTTVPDVKFEAGKSYTVVVFHASGKGQSLDTLVIEDKPATLARGN